MPYYAQINEDGVCIAVSELTAEVDAPHMIALAGLDRSLLGRTWDGSKWGAAPIDNATDPAEWLIDVGPFFDRFGAAKMAVLSSSDAIVRALVTDLQVRKWIDLKRADVVQGIDLLISKSLISAASKDVILTTPVEHVENLALRKMYFA